MNTPAPCDSCYNLYYDCMYKDDPGYLAECKLGLELGNMDCPEYYKFHIICEGSHEHVISWDSKGQKCSEPKCIINKHRKEK